MLNSIRGFIKLSGIDQIIWLNPLLVGIIPAAIIIWLQPVKFDPFLFELFEIYAKEQYLAWYEDLENDGKKEKLMFGTDNMNVLNIMYFNDEGDLVNQINFEHSFAKKRKLIKPACADFDNDGIKDILIFSQNSDSLFLNIFSYKKEIILIENRFVTKIGGYNEHQDFYVQPIGFQDVTRDSVPEFYFSIAAGHALFPRRLFRYNFAEDKLITSINTGAGHLKGKLSNRGDSVTLFVSGVAYGNVREHYPFPYHDSTAWLFVLDENLNLKTPPKSYGNNPGSLSNVIERNDYFYCIYGTNNSFKDKNRLLKMNWAGEVLDSIVFDFYASPYLQCIEGTHKKYDFLYNRETWEFLLFDAVNFKVLPFKKLKLSGMPEILLVEDLNKDGEPESVFFNGFNRDLFLLSSNLKTKIFIGQDKNVRLATANYFQTKDYGELVTVSDEFSKIYRYTKNPNQKFKYPLWFGIYFISALFVSLILYFQNKRNSNRQKLEQQLADLQLQNLRNQLDPHFTFNVLNTIGSFIYKQDKEKAYDLFQRFTRIIRSSLLVSDKIFRPLNEEIQFTKDYLEFQKIRFKNRFEYIFKIDEKIDLTNVKFPKMLIQGFAENAVKHAFYGVDYTGQISIHIVKKNRKLFIVIEDDGIGINRSKELKATSGTQKGQQILEDQVEQINRLYHTDHSVIIQDKSEITPVETGTRVTISVSLT